MRDPEDLYRRYLLGRLSDEDAERLEDAMLGDDDVYQLVRSAEDDVIDEIASGRLSAHDTEVFLKKHPDVGHRVAFARALAMRANVVSMPSRRWMIPAAVAASVAVASLMLFFPREREQAPPAPVVARRVAPQVAAQVVVATIAIGGSRSEEQTPSVEIPADAAAVELHVRIDPADIYENYSVTVGSHESSAEVRTTAEGDRFVTARIPARVLADGRSEVSVRGESAGGQAETLGFTTLEVRRIP